MKTLKSSLLAASLALTFAFSANAQAQETKFGFVNIDRIFRDANSSKAAQTKLEQEFSKREKELIELGNALKTASEKLEKDAPTLSESQRATRQKQLVDQDREFQRKRREFQEDLGSRKNEELQTVLECANKVV